MSNYLSITDEERKKMLEAIGVKSLDDLFADVPKSLWIRKLNIPDGKSQQEVFEAMQELAAKNTTYRVILRGAGAYWHYIPPAVKNLSNRSEFLTAYTPYQSEINQGLLQSIFEYQSMICELTGMDVSNSSVYSGATAAAEGILMCETAEKKSVIVSDNINPDTLAVITTYLERRNLTLIKLAHKDGLTNYDVLKSTIEGGGIACVYLEQLNYFGLIEDVEEIARLARDYGVKVVLGINPIAAAILKSAAECGADIAVGDAGSLGLPLNFGGPSVGFMACTAKEQRKLPGRIVGETKDNKGNRAFVLTMQAREQHIRREKASSNICTNSAHGALTAAMYLTAMGPAGLKEAAMTCNSMAHYAAEGMVAGQKPDNPSVKLKYSAISAGEVTKGEFFFEFVTEHKTKASKIIEKLEKEGILGGLEIGEHEILWCFTEMVKKEDADRAIEIIRKA